MTALGHTTYYRGKARSMIHVSPDVFFLKNFIFIVYLAVPGLNCGMGDL